ncbi:MAG: transposase, partial [Acidimicrobiia bacterium]|nr:transposase [Acidimicrobiia bacterium]
AKLRGLLAAGDLRGEVRLAWHAKETLRGLYDLDCPQIASAYLTELAEGLTDGDCPPELRRLGRTLGRWHTAIVNWHRARVTNGPTLAINNLVKRVKRAAFGFRRFAHYRIRALLYAGRPNWALLAGLTPR